MSRPELQAPPEIYYDDTVAQKYTKNSRNQEIQAAMTYRALELLALPEDQPAFLLDIGCGSGLSGEILEEQGHIWAGADISPSMLEVALERDVEGDLFLQDVGQGFGFRPGSFDGAISVSVLQWLFNAETSHPTMSPPHRLARFFTTLHAALKNPSRAVLQFYPTSDEQITMCSTIARRAGFGGGIVVDYPNSKKARKVFLCLYVGSGSYAGSSATVEVPRGLQGEGEMDGDEDEARFERRREREHKRGSLKRKNLKVKDKEWVMLSFIDNEARKTFLGTRSIQVESGGLFSSGYLFLCNTCVRKIVKLPRYGPQLCTRSIMAIPAGFRALPLPLTQLSLAAVLKCGQSFRWSVLPLSDPVEYRFALRDRVVCLRQSEEMLYYRAVFPDANAHTQMDDLHTLAWLRDYFQLDVDLEHLYDTWSDSDPVFSKFRSRFKGIRMLRQDPWECLVSFICSQNNHISRITKMVESLCACFSPPVLQAYHPFPTPSALASPKTSSILRGLGFGYRAEYIQRTAQMLVDEHGAEGAEPFLMGLRDKKAEVAREELLKFVGVGRKVADCVLLMSLDKHDIVPVDTHVHKIAIKHYGLRTATMNPKLYQEIQMKFAKVWGDYAGWAHTVLFTADLKSFSAYGLPTPSPSVSPEKGKRKRSTKPEEESPRPRRHIAKESSLKEEPEVKEEGDLADRVKRRRARRTVAKQSMIYVEPIPA